MQVMRMCDAFAGQGAELTLVHPDTPGPTPEGFEGDTARFYGVGQGFERRSLPVRSKRVEGEDKLEPTRASRLAALGGYLLWRSRPGRPPFVCYARSMLAAWLASRVRRTWGSRSACRAVLLELHDQPRDRASWRVLEGVDGVVAISAALRSRLVEGTADIDEGRIWVEHDGVDVRSVRRPQQDRTALRKRLGVADGGGPLVVYTGRANRDKGVDVLLDAAGRLQAIGADVLVVGKVYEPELERDAERNVHFTGFVPPASVPDYLAAADILVMPSTPDLPYSAYTSPLKLFEYMASGRPVAASDLPVLGEVLGHEENALLYPSRDAGALAAAIERLVADEALALRLAAQASLDVQEYSWERRAGRILDRIAGWAP